MTDAPIDMVEPINWDDPLARGLVAAYICLPGITGGSRWIDLVNPGPHGNHGTLTNMDPATDWQVTNRPGGWGHLDFARTAPQDYVNIPYSPKFDFGTGDFTFTGWVRFTDSYDYSTILVKDSTGNGDGIALSRNTGDDVLRTWVGGVAQNGTIPLSGIWRHICLTRLGGTAYQFIDGKLDVSFAAAGNTNTSSPPIQIGYWAQWASYPSDGQYDEFLLWNRGMAAAEVQDFWGSSKQRHPGLLRRQQRRTIFVPTAAVANPWFFQNMIRKRRVG